MPIGGTVYGVALNDTAECDALAGQLQAAPYNAPPVAPIVYIKPRNCIQPGGGVVRLPQGAGEAVMASTVAVHFARSVTDGGPADAVAAIGAVSLAIDVSLPGADYYRPAIAEKCRDGFLPVGRAVAPAGALDALVIETLVDGGKVHEWRLDRLHRPIGQLVAELSSFMTLEAGDVLLVGTAGDAPRASLGSTVTVRAAGFPDLETRVAEEIQ